MSGRSLYKVRRSLYKVNDGSIRITAILFMTLLSMLNQDLLGFFATGEKGWQVLYFLIYNAAYWELNRLVVLHVYNRLPPGISMRRRLMTVFLYCYVTTIIFRICGSYTRHFLFDLPFFPLWALIQIFGLVSLGSVWLIVGTYDILYSNAETAKEEEEKEALIRANIQSRFDSLKGQINPHFLFNNLNALTTLITKNPARADKFVEEMSSVYRYLLRNTEETLACLRDELEFCRSYQYLLMTRFGTGFQPAVDVDDACLDYRIPALSMQLLIENAVKYNIVSPEEPLKLNIFLRDNRLVISNNLQRKVQAVTSEGYGLSTIVLRYKLLNEAAVEISETDEDFTVSLPLIKP